MEPTTTGSSTPIILDCGSGITKAGIGGETMPRSVFPTLVGKPKVATGMPLMAGKSEYIGDEAMNKKGILRLEFPVENGNIKNWDSMLSLWSHLFMNELRMSPEEFPVLMTDPDRDPKVNKEKIAQIMFEKMKTPALFLVNPGILSLYANAVITGTAVDCGDCLTLCVPGDQGMADTKGMKKKYFGGRQLTQYLTQLLNEKENLFQTTGEQYNVKTIKETSCFVALDPATADKSVEALEYTLPDGTKISLTEERFKCPECLFNPQAVVGKVEEGLHTFVMDSIKKCDESLHGPLLENVVLAGGSTLFPGLPERLEKELNAIAPAGLKAVVKAPKNRMYSAWIGGSVISSLSTFKHMWLSRAEYQEHGAKILGTKFPV